MAIEFKKPSFEVRCPIHTSIYFNDFEKLFIDSAVFQRLRFISQLGFVSVAYPSALHNRFTHSLGVMYLASQLFDQIIETSLAELSAFYTTSELAHFKQVVRLAGLLHDIGHGPFSHTFEQHLPTVEKIDLPLNWYLKPKNVKHKAHHEDLSIALINYLFSGPEIKNKVPTLMGQAVASLISSEISPQDYFCSAIDKEVTIYPLLKSLISGELDADRMDYLLRDSYFCGVPYGKYDSYRLVQNVQAYWDSKNKRFDLAIRKNALFSFEDFLIARYHMFQQVYFLKTIPPFDYYLAQAIKEKEIAIPWDGTLEQYVGLRDDVIWAQLFKNCEKPWSGRIVYRVPAHHLYTIDDVHQESHWGLKNILMQILKKENIDVFVLRATQYLSGVGRKSERLYVVSELLGQQKAELVENYSTLLARYNVRIEKDNIYCLKEDKQRAISTISKTLSQDESQDVWANNVLNG